MYCAAVHHVLRLSSTEVPFPPPALPSFSGTTNPSATPKRPACPSRASSWSLALTTPWCFPCCVRFPSVHASATTPAHPLAPSFPPQPHPSHPPPTSHPPRPP